jgi:hypothetical protein
MVHRHIPTYPQELGTLLQDTKRLDLVGVDIGTTQKRFTV